MKARISRVFGRIFYFSILFIIAFSTLEQFSQVNSDFELLTRPIYFHGVMGLLALAAALYESITLRGLSGIRDFFESPDPIAYAPRPGDCVYRQAFDDKDLLRIRKLARQGYRTAAFPLKDLKRWHSCNSACFFLMFYDGDLVGYLDAFPISESDYDHLQKGQPEKTVTPLPPQAVDEKSSFYIASLVIKEGFGGLILPFFTKARRFYERTYPKKVWSRVCAIGYSDRGIELLEQRGLILKGTEQKAKMYQLNRETMLSKSNQKFWQGLFPALVNKQPTR